AAATTSLHVAAAVAFDDAKAAADTLAALRANPDLVSAEVIAAGDRLLARYQRSVPRSTQPESRAATSSGGFSRLTVVRRIKLDGERIGSLRLTADLSALWRHLLTQLFIIAASTLVAFLLALRLAHKFKHMIEAPILELAATAAQISREGDYSLRVKRQA